MSTEDKENKKTAVHTVDGITYTGVGTGTIPTDVIHLPADDGYYDYYSDYPETLFNNVLSAMGINRAYGKGKCSACKEHTDLAITYSGPGVSRFICKNCCVSKIDKIFGVESNIEVEKMLYEKK